MGVHMEVHFGERRRDEDVSRKYVRMFPSWHAADNVYIPPHTGRCRRSPMPPLPLPLPTNRAFVVQLRTQPPGAPLVWDGRVEHVVSGQMTHFHLLEEFAAFIYPVPLNMPLPISPSVHEV